MRYSTIQDVIEQDIAPALSGFEGDYDTAAIADRAFAWRIDHDVRGNELLNTGGFEQAVSEPEFWKIVRECVIG